MQKQVQLYLINAMNSVVLEVQPYTGFLLTWKIWKSWKLMEFC